MRPVPHIEGNLRHLIIFENVLQPFGDKFIADRCTRRQFKVAVRRPLVVWRVISRRLFREMIGGEPKDRADMPYAVDIDMAEDKRGQVAAFREVEAAEDTETQRRTARRRTPAMRLDR